MRVKSILVIVGILIIGFILGMLTSAQIRYHRLKPVRVFFSEERFRDGFYKTIQPDDQQKAKIELILNKYAKINGMLQSNFRRELDSSMRSFRKELDLNLTKDQLDRLKEMDQRRQDMIRRNWRNHDNDSLNSMGDRWHGRMRPHGGQDPSDKQSDTSGLPDTK